MRLMLKKSRLAKIWQRFHYLLLPDYVHFENYVLPARRLRTGGAEFQDDAYLLQSAKNEGRRLIEHGRLQATERVLDVGCGFGRLPLGLLDAPFKLAYLGLDVNPTAITWCQHHITPIRPAFQFMRLNVKNDRYNPNGQPLDDQFHFPLPERSFDVIYLYSVFSHMVLPDVAIYLKEFRRLLNQNGRLFFTAFTEKDVPIMSVNPANYRNMKWKSALHCVRYNVDFLNALITDHGFQLDKFVYEQETNGQSAFYLSVPL
jgi:SAM-dependent methyltransferase